jgi:hypothetical protein
MLAAMNFIWLQRLAIRFKCDFLLPRYICTKFKRMFISLMVCFLCCTFVTKNICIIGFEGNLLLHFKFKNYTACITFVL